MIALFAALLLGGGCASEASEGLPLTIEVQESRLPDGLLNRPELQRVVDLQVERDGGALVEHLPHENPLVRARALFALASVQDPAAVPAILPLLLDDEWTVRRDAALALGQAGDESAADAMLDALVTEDVRAVRRRLMEGIGKIGDADALRRLHALPASAPARADPAQWLLSLARFGIRGIHRPEVTRTLADALSDPDAEVRESAAYYFGRVTETGHWSAVAGALRESLDGLDRTGPADPAAMHLINGLGRLADPADRARFMAWAAEADDWRIRTNAVRALGSQPGGVRVREALANALDDSSGHVSVAAATALASRELPGGELERIRRWIDEHPGEWRVAAPLLTALARQGHEEFVVAWRDGWRESDVLPRSAALRALSAAPGESAFRALLAAASSSNPRISATAVTALAGRWPSDRRDEATHPRYFAAFRNALQSGNVPAAAAAAPILAASAFRPLGASSLLEQSYRAMSAPGDAAAMIAILEALAETDEPEFASLLREAVDNPHAGIRAAAARGLERLTGELVEVEPPLSSGGASPGEEGVRIDWARFEAIGRTPRLILETEKGRIVLVLAAEEAPMTVQTIVDFARDGRYDGVPFHRVVSNFVIQGGDFRQGDRADEAPVDPPSPIRSEFTGILFGRGIIGMASAGKDTETSQYFITHSMQPHLDGGYTAFGWVVEGMDVVDALYEGDRVIRARVERGSP